jgi:choline kinase
VIGMVLAAGAGRRLRPFTDELPKALIPVDGERTILDIALDNLAKVGITEVVIVVGHASQAIEQRKAELEQRYGLRLTLVQNDHADDWNNAYSMWTARDLMCDGVLLLNGDTVHPVAIEETLLASRGPAVLLAVDAFKELADEEMKVTVDESGAVRRITKSMDPAEAFGEYIGAALVEAEAVPQLIDALEATWRRDPNLYYEDAYQEVVDRGGVVMTLPIPWGTRWVEVDNRDDLARAREIACHY